MNYSFSECNKDCVNKYNIESEKGHFFQTSMWCEFKEDWGKKYIKGVDEKGETVLTCSLIKRKIPYLGGYIGYIPRGMTCDYKNKELIQSFSDYVKGYCKGEKIAFLTIDPDIHLEENETATIYGEDVKNILLGVGFEQINSDSKNFEAIQPNYVFRLDISNKDNESNSKHKDNVFKSFHSKWRYNIRLGKERCLSVEVYDKNNITDTMLDEFQFLMEMTGKRDDFIVRKKAYFKSMIENMFPFVKLYMVKYDLSLDRKKSEEKIKDLQKEVNVLTVKMNTLSEKIKAGVEVVSEKELKSHNENINRIPAIKQQLEKLQERILKIDEYGKDSVYLSGALYMYYGNKGWYLYGASSNDFRDTMPNFSMQWAMISDSIDLGLDVYDFRGVSGDLNPENPLYGLYKFKKGFGGDFVEFVGEFDMVFNRLIYRLFKNVFPKYKEARKNLMLRKK